MCIPPNSFLLKHCLTPDNTFLLQGWETKEESSYPTCHWNPGDPGDMARADGLRCAARTQEAVGSECLRQPSSHPTSTCILCSSGSELFLCSDVWGSRGCCCYWYIPEGASSLLPLCPFVPSITWAWKAAFPGTNWSSLELILKTQLKGGRKWTNTGWANGLCPRESPGWAGEMGSTCLVEATLFSTWHRN